MFKNLKTALSLFFQSPKDYLYSFTYSDKDRFAIKPFDPGVFEYAQRFIGTIKEMEPNLNAYLIGSTGLKIAGRGDVDLFVTAQRVDLNAVSSKIGRKFGEPDKIKPDLIEWKIKDGGVDVDLTLTHPQNKRFQEQILLFNLLKNNLVFLNEYRNLKQGLNGCTRKHYTRKRMEFFNRVLSSVTRFQ